MLRLLIVLAFLMVGIVSVIIAIYSLYTILKPHRYRVINLNELFDKNIFYYKEETAYMMMIAELIETIEYNNNVLNTEYEKYNKVYILTAIAAVSNILACLLNIIIL